MVKPYEKSTAATIPETSAELNAFWEDTGEFTLPKTQTQAQALIETDTGSFAISAAHAGSEAVRRVRLSRELQTEKGGQA